MECASHLLEIAQSTLAACRFEKDCRYYGAERRLPVFLPAGDDKYPSFWVRDCVMSSLSGLMADDDLLHYIEYIALCGQNGPEPRALQHALRVPPFAVADHINYNGRPVFFPGTYSDGDDQGQGAFGFYPPLDDNYWFILMAAQYVRQTGDRAVLRRDYAGMALGERLTRAWEGYCIDPKTGLCTGDDRRYVVDWGFCDSIHKSGLMLMPSLLRRQAALALQEMGLMGDGTARAQRIDESILSNLYDPESGWFYSASRICRQWDVWSTAYAVSIGVLDGRTQALERTRKALETAYIRRTAVEHGYVRQLPLSCDPPYWQSKGPGGGYQNEDYWSTPTGWYYAALKPQAPDLAQALMEEFIRHTWRHRELGAPFEFINRDMSRYSGCVYATSAALPYAEYMRMNAVP